MGVGDNIMATGMARGASARGKRIAFGDGHRIIWDQNSRPIFARNPNIAHPGQEGSARNEWIGFYRGNRIYNTKGAGRWIWNYDFRAKPGEMFLSRDEKLIAEKQAKHPKGEAVLGLVVIEPNVPAWKTVAQNKQWPVDRYDAVALKLRIAGYDVVQFAYPGALHRMPAARQVTTANFRAGVALLARAALYIGAEGGLHHAAAAVSIPAVVLFGGFIPPQVTGYATHTNLTGGAEACGSLSTCQHCRAAMARITVDEVAEAAMKHLGQQATLVTA